MNTLSASFSYATGFFPRRTVVAALCATTTALFLVLYVACVGLSISARASFARASARADATTARLAQWESRLSHTVATPIVAAADGFVPPLSFSYAMKRPLGRAPSPHEL